MNETIVAGNFNMIEIEQEHSVSTAPNEISKPNSVTSASANVAVQEPIVPHHHHLIMGLLHNHKM